MALRERFSHLPPERQAAYRRMLTESPRLVTSMEVTEEHTEWRPCIYRGDESGTCKLRLCCGQPDVGPVAAWDCTLLNVRCIEFGTPGERGVETCSRCSEKA